MRHLTLLQRLVIILLVVGLVYPAGVVFSGAVNDIPRIFKVLPYPGAWRGVRFATNENFANYMEFLRATVPLNGTIGLPPQEAARKSNAGWALASTPFMQFFLAPRQVVNCTAQQPGCAAALAEKGAYLVILGNAGFPSAEVMDSTENVRMFNANWGVYLPERSDSSKPGVGDIGTSILPDSEGVGLFPLRKVFFQLILVGLWLALHAIFGALLLVSWLPGLPALTSITLGLGLATGWLSFSLFLMVWMGAHISPGWAAVSTLTWVLLCLAFFWLGGDRQSVRVGLLRLRDGFLGECLIWYAAFFALAGLAAFLAVGKGYATSDEFFIWGAKGYGIAYDGLPAGVTMWGTQTTRYPLEVPLMIAAIKTLTGDLVAQSKLIFPFFYFGLLVLIFDFLRFRMKSWIAGLACLVLAFSPFIFRHATLAYANLPLTFHLVAAVLLVLLAFSELDSRRSLRFASLAGVFLALAAWTRPEGLLLSLVIVLAAVVLFWNSWRERKLAINGSPGRRVGFAMIPFALLIPIVTFEIIWILWGVTYEGINTPISHQEITLVTVSDALRGIRSGSYHLDEAGYLLKSLGQQLVAHKLWGLVGLGILVFLLLGRISGRPDHEVSFLLLCGGLMLATILLMYFALSYDRVHDISWWVTTGLNRMLMPAFCVLWVGAATWIFKPAGGLKHLD